MKFILLFILFFSQEIDFSFDYSQKSISLEKFKGYMNNNGFSNNNQGNEISFYLSNELYPYSDKYNLSQPLVFNKPVSKDKLMEITSYYEESSKLLKYFEIVIDKIKPEIEQIIDKYKKKESDVSKITKLSLEEFQSYKLTKNEIVDISKVFENEIIKSLGKPNKINSKNLVWKTKYNNVTLVTEKDIVKIIVYWQ